MVKPLHKSFQEEKKGDQQESPLLLLPGFYSGCDFVEVAVDQINGIEYIRLDKSRQKDNPGCHRIRINLRKGSYDTIINMDRFREMLAVAKQDRVDVDCRTFRTKEELDIANRASAFLKGGQKPNAT
jgi:hypothetical protein